MQSWVVQFTAILWMAFAGGSTAHCQTNASIAALKSKIESALPRVVRALKSYRPLYRDLENDEVIFQQPVCEQASRFLGVLLDQPESPVRLIGGTGHNYLIVGSPPNEIVIDPTYRQFFVPPQANELQALELFKKAGLPKALVIPRNQLASELKRLGSAMGLTSEQVQRAIDAHRALFDSRIEISSTSAVMHLNNSLLKLTGDRLYNNQYAILGKAGTGETSATLSYLFQTPQGKWKILTSGGFTDLHSTLLSRGLFPKGLPDFPAIGAGRGGLFITTTEGDRLIFSKDYFPSASLRALYQAIQDLDQAGIKIVLDSSLDNLALAPLASAVERALPALFDSPKGPQVSVTAESSSLSQSFSLSKYLRPEPCTLFFQ